MRSNPVSFLLYELWRPLEKQFFDQKDNMYQLYATVLIDVCYKLYAEVVVNPHKENLPPSALQWDKKRLRRVMRINVFLNVV